MFAITSFTQSDFWAQLLLDGLGLLKNIVAAVVIYFVGMFIAKRVLTFIGSRLRKRQVDETAIGFLGSLLNFAFRAIVIVIALAALKIPMASITAIIAAASLSIGLALQGSLSNLAGGIVLVLFKPFRVGDYVLSGDAEGTVEGITLLTTSLITPDNKRVLIPNALISSQTLVNVTAFPVRRIDITTGLNVHSDPEQVRGILQGIARSLPQTLQEKPIEVLATEGADASLRMTLRFWVESKNYIFTYAHTLETIKKTMREEGIDFYLPSVLLEEAEKRHA